MKHPIYILFIWFFLSMGNAAAQYNEQGHLEEHLCAEQKSMATIQQNRSLVSDNYDLRYHRCDWAVDPAVNFIQGNITSYFTAKANPLSQVDFDFRSGMQCDSVLYHGTALTFSHNADVLSITLPSAIAAGTLDSLTVYYQGAPISSGFGTFNMASHAGTPILWTLSCPFGGLDWWPCKIDLNDKIDSIDVFCKVPGGNRVASNGLLLDSLPVGSDVKYHWKSRYPISSYLICLAITNYSAYSNYVPMSNGDSLEVLNYVYPESLSSALTLTPDIIQTIQFYDSLTIPYPFKDEKYGHAQFNWGGGMEHQTMSFVVSFGHSLMAHECAHQWFGDRITCGSWQDVWLNEGFATYFDGLTTERFNNITWRSWKQAKITNIAAIANGSVWCSDTTDVARIFSTRLTYNKGAYLLHMLRWKLGDNAFFQGIRNYLNDPLLAYGYARTSDFQHHLELASGISLNNFFTQWFYGQGYPRYNLVWTATNNQVDLQAFQTTSDPSVSFFEMPIPVKFSNGVQDTILVFEHQFSGQQFQRNLNFTPTSASFDPDLWILSKNNQVTVGVAENQVQHTAYLYPNPADDQLVLFLHHASTEKMRVQVFSMEGKLMEEHAFTGQEIHLDTRAIPTGQYFLRLSGKSESSEYRFAVMH